MTQPSEPSHALDAAERAWLAEEAVYRPETRHDAATLERLFAPGFHEIGQSGRHWERDELIADLVAAAASTDGTSGDPSFQMSERRADHLPDGGILLTYLIEFGGRRSRRSSVWVPRDDELVLAFHQGTTVQD